MVPQSRSTRGAEPQKCRWILRPAVSSREAFREAAGAARAGGQVLESSTTPFLLKAMNEQRLKEEGATAYSGGVACADSLGGKRGGVEWRWCSCQFVASCICIVGFPPNKRWMDGQLDSLGLLLPTKRMCFWWHRCWWWWGWCRRTFCFYCLWTLDLGIRRGPIEACESVSECADPFTKKIKYMR